MEGLMIILGGTGMIAWGLIFWISYTKSGKKWLNSLSD